MDAEIKMIKKNSTWAIVDRPIDQSVIGVKWIYRIKLIIDGSINKYKARLVVKGYAHVYGIDYFETFALVARYDTIRMLAALSIREG